MGASGGVILLALLLAQAPVIYDDPGDAPPVPDAVQDAYSKYSLCLLDPLQPAIEGNGPKEKDARVALVRDALASCHAQRLASVAEMEAKFPRTGAFRDPAKRSARIAEIFGKLEQRMSFIILSPEEFRAAAAEMWACLNKGGGDSCTPSHPMK